jgi:biopolymer transport protein ExbB/TolQ
MIPVMLALLFGLVYTLYLAGITVYEFISRMQRRDLEKELVAALENKSSTIPEFDGYNEFEQTVNLIIADKNDQLLIGKRIASIESLRRTELQKIADLTKYGPAIGLMGTLIPLGPALVGLARGDLETLSNNMIIAFATTVVGILISLIAMAIHSAKKSWYRDDSILLTFTAERIAEIKNNDNDDHDAEDNDNDTANTNDTIQGG